MLKNEKVLKFSSIIVIDNDGTNLGVMDPRKALRSAKEKGYDLVVVDPKPENPVCKIMDYGKFQYEQNSKKTVKPKEQKCMTFRPATSNHDMDTVARKVRNFIEHGHKVRLECRFRSRELSHPELGKSRIEYVHTALEDVIKVEKAPTLDGRAMFSIISPK